ncbi:hypothetical protein PVAP13_5KG128587 [Panicum virgatum]|uniref:Uncharacterized protein n=1 Tax=Panicum virgatum TaxID=38727 RepID=A0A8T0SHI7_PANVG|nr:hypothetical protein PVAP13_5KG128587 [Panicum virgatum]
MASLPRPPPPVHATRLRHGRRHLLADILPRHAAGLLKEPHHLGLAHGGRCLGSGSSLHRRGLGVRAVLQEEVHHLGTARLGGAVQRRVAVGVSGVDVGAAVDEVAHRVDAPLEGGAHDRRPPVRVPALDGRAAVGRAPDGPRLALPRGGEDRLAEAQEVHDPPSVALLGGDLEGRLPRRVAHRGRAGHAVRQEAACSAVAPSVPHRTSRRPSRPPRGGPSPRPAASRRGVLPSLPAALMDVKENEKDADEDEAGEAVEGFPRSSFRTSLWPAAASTWIASDPAGVAPLARRSSALRHSPDAAGVSSGLSASAPYSSSTWTMSARPRPTARSSSVRSSTSLSASTAPASIMFIRWILSHSKYSDLQSVQNALPSLQWHAHESSVFSSRPPKNNGSFSVRVTGDRIELKTT